MQNLQPILQPAWEDTHRVLRSPSGIITASTALPGSPFTGKRYLQVPSTDTALSSGRATPTSYSSSSRSRPALDMLVISAMERTRLP